MHQIINVNSEAPKDIKRTFWVPKFGCKRGDTSTVILAKTRRLDLVAPEPEEPAFKLLVGGKGGVCSGINLDLTSELSSEE